MLFRSNASAHRPVDNPVDKPVDGCGQEKVERPQELHSEDDAELFWPNGYDRPVDRDTFLAELTFERFGFKPRTSRRRAGETNHEKESR